MIALLGFFFGVGASVSAQELYNEDQGTYRAVVREIVSQEMRKIPGTETEHLFQTLRVEILEGPKKGKTVTIENDYLELEAGGRFSMDGYAIV